MNTNSNMWILNFGKSLIENYFKWNFINPEIDIIPTTIKDILENLFVCKLQLVIRFPYNGNKYSSVNKYAICMFSKNKLTAKVNMYELKIIDKNTSITQLIENNKKHALHFNFRDIKQIYVPRTIHDGVMWDEDIIRINITETIKKYKDENKIKLMHKLQHITCDDLTNMIFTYL